MSPYNPYNARSETAPLVVRLSRGMLLALIAFMYSGIFTRQPAFYVYLAMIGLVFLIIVLDKPQIDIYTVAPYLFWVTLYSLWGTIVTPFPAAALPEAVRMILHNLILISALVISLPAMSDFVRLSRMIQVVIVVNFSIMLQELNDPDVILRITGERAAISDRPAGLWIDPNQAAFAFLLGLLFCGKDRSAVAWIARIAAPIGIILTASRTGTILLGLFGLAYLLYKLRRMRLAFGHVVVLVNAVALLALFAFATLEVAGLKDLDFTSLEVPVHERLFDLTEEQAGSGSQAVTRRSLREAAAQAAFEGPWYGSGIFSFQDPEMGRGDVFPIVGSHNMYLATWGEVGILGLFTYLALLALGIGRLLRARLSVEDRFIGAFLWTEYLVIGFVTHGQFSTSISILFIGLLYYFPRLAERSPLTSSAHPEHSGGGPARRTQTIGR